MTSPPGPEGPVEPLAHEGRARRSTWGPSRVLVRLEGDQGALAERVAALGRAGLFGVAASGVDDEGPWLLLDRAGRTLAELAPRTKGSPWPAPDVVRVGIDLARALSAAEGASLFPGPLDPNEVLIRADGGAVFLAEGLLRALFGARAEGASPHESVALLYTPPEQARGEPWGAAANRYVLGLLLYRLLTGEHPFAGAGLRHALELQAVEPPPFAEAIAQGAPPGLQSLVLRLLAPQLSERPSAATAVRDALLALARGDAPAPKRRRSAAERASSATSASEATRAQPHLDAGGREASRGPAATAPRRASRPPRASWVARLGPVAVASALGGVALAIVLGASGPGERAPTRAAGTARPVTSSAMLATDCATCHAREANEWRRSVMAHSVKSPLFNALEALIEEQVGRDRDCPNGAGILRKVDAARACRSPLERGLGGHLVTGSGGEHWCVSCHAPAENLAPVMPAWDAFTPGSRARRPVRDLLGQQGNEGISCGFCHTVHGPVGRRGSGRYEGNPTWTSFVTGATFASRPEDLRGVFGIANSGYDLRQETLLGRGARDERGLVPGGAHARPSEDTRRYLASSEFCGSCHDVRLFGTDVLGARKGEHFKRLRNAYGEWAAWASDERARGREPASCQDCHMSSYPGTCEPSSERGAPDPMGCPEGTRFSPKRPGERPRGRVSEASTEVVPLAPHYFSGVDLPLARDYPRELVDERTLDLAGLPLSAKRRRDLLLRSALRFEIEGAKQRGDRLEIPVVVENVGAGHRVPAGFSQERELWVELVVRDARGRVLYEVGRVGRNDEDLRDKVFLAVSTEPDALDERGRPVGLFGADVADGPDVPRWSPNPAEGGSRFRGRGLVNFQNGFLRCVRCIGVLGPEGECLPGPGQGRHRADRFVDGDYDLDTGECRSNLSGTRALFETYFPVGALDASRGLVRAPDAIVDTRSLPPNSPVTYTFDLATEGRPGPFTVEARLLFRAFPPFLLRAFAAYEARMAQKGLRPSGPLLDASVFERIEVVPLATRKVELR